MQQQPQQVVRRGPPPKFRPFMIIVVVMSLGLLFVGMTLTIIAHWPGYTAIGNNPLKIVGPVLLSVGGVVFIGCIAEVVRKSQSDKESFTRQMQERERMMSFVNRTARSNPASSQYSLNHPTMHQQQQPPGRGILKSNTGSQYAGSQYGDSGVGQTTGSRTYNSSATNMSYQPDAASQGSGAGTGRFEVHNMPDPNQYNGYPNGYGQGNQQGYQPATPTQGYSPTPQQGFQPPTPQQGYLPQDQGYGQQGYNPQGQGYSPSPQPYSDPNPPEADIPQPMRTRTRDTKKKVTANPQYNNGYQPDGQQEFGSGAVNYAGSQDSHNSSLVQADIHAAPSPPSNDPQDRDAKRKRRAEKKRQKEQASVQQGANPGGNDPLHISIKAGPGVGVTITPQGTPSMDRHNTTETDI